MTDVLLRDEGDQLKVARAKKRLEKKKKRRGKESSCDDPLQPGVVYVGHLPHGFYEGQLKSYFSQFGSVNKLRVSRNKKTGRCRGYAFIEFSCDEVAKIVASTMNNYLMFNKMLKCQFIEPEQVHRGMLGRRGMKVKEIKAKWRQHRAQRLHNQGRSMSSYHKRLSRLLKAERKKRSKLRDAKIDYEFPGYAQALTTSCANITPSHTLFDN